MGPLTGLLYGLLAIYLGGWFLGFWVGNFALLLFVLTVVTLAYWLAERLRFQPAAPSCSARASRSTTWTSPTPAASC